MSKSKDLAHACENLVFEDDTLRAFGCMHVGRRPESIGIGFGSGIILGTRLFNIDPDRYPVA